MKITQREKKLLKQMDESIDDLAFWAWRYFMTRKSVSACMYRRNLVEAIGAGLVSPPSLDGIQQDIDRERHFYHLEADVRAELYKIWFAVQARKETTKC